MPQIYVELLADGTRVWRPVEATDLGSGVFEIAVTEQPVDERWAFGPGERVLVAPRVLSGGESAMVAVERVAPAS